VRHRILSVLGYAMAAATLLVALLVPFKLMGGIASLVSHAGLRIDPVYSGGTPLRTIARNGYTLTIYTLVRPHLLQRGEPFQQVVFAPVSALPTHVEESIDMDGDGTPDLRVVFDVPANPATPLRASVQALNGNYQSLAAVSNDSFTRLLARTGNRIVLRVPLAKSN